jgi:hypothetical protein
MTLDPAVDAVRSEALGFDATPDGFEQTFPTGV